MGFEASPMEAEATPGSVKGVAKSFRRLSCSKG